MSSNPAITVGINAVDKASNVLAQFDGNVAKTAGAVEASSTKVTKVTETMSTRFKANMATVTTTAVTLSASMVAFATSFDTLERASLAADRANLMYAKSLETLNDMQASGKASSQDLANATEQVRINSERARLAQDAASDTYANFLANVPLQMISAGASMALMFEAITGKSIVLTLATHGLKFAMISAFITNPVGIAIIAITTLITLLVFNVGGLRDAVLGLGKTILAFLDQHFKPLADAIRWFIDGIMSLTGQVGEEMPASFKTASAAAGEFGDTTMYVKKSVKGASDELETYQDFLVRTGKTTIEATNSNFNFLQSIGRIDIALTSTNEQASLAANYLRDLEAETKRATQENFNLIASFAGLEAALNKSNDGLAKQAKLIAEAVELEKKYGDKADPTDKYDEFGRRRDGGKKTVTITDDDVKKHKGSLIDAISSKSGRSLDNGGILYEDVIGFGIRTGTLHKLHQGEAVTPQGMQPIVNVEIVSSDPNTSVRVNGKTFRSHIRRVTNLPRY